MVSAQGQVKTGQALQEGRVQGVERGSRGRHEEGGPGARKGKTTWNRQDVVSGEGRWLQTELSGFKKPQHGLGVLSVGTFIFFSEHPDTLEAGPGPTLQTQLSGWPLTLCLITPYFRKAGLTPGSEYQGMKRAWSSRKQGCQAQQA